MAELTSHQTSPLEQVLLRELNHRVNNEFASIISAVSLATARSSNEDVKLALIGVSELLHHHADVHHALQMPADDTPVDVVAHLSQLCRSISLSKLEDRGIELTLSACPLWLHADQCWRLGMIVYELITNAARHALSKRGGEIRIELSHEGESVKLRVQDNGSAPDNVQPGCGLKIINALTQVLDGQFEQHFGAQGSTATLVFRCNTRLDSPRL
jgi:two-component sensor histidine kinase